MDPEPEEEKPEENPQVGFFRRTVSQPQMNGPQEQWRLPGGSLYGTDHPLDLALGKARRLGNLASLAKGTPTEGM